MTQRLRCATADLLVSVSVAGASVERDDVFLELGAEAGR